MAKANTPNPKHDRKFIMMTTNALRSERQADNDLLVYGSAERGGVRYIRGFSYGGHAFSCLSVPPRWMPTDHGRADLFVAEKVADDQLASGGCRGFLT